MPEAVSKQFAGHGADQVGYVGRGCPAPFSVVDDDGQHEGVLAARPQILLAKLHPDGRRVVRHSQGHAAVDGGLKLQQDQDVDPAAASGRDAPEHVGVPLPEVLGDEAGGHAFQCGEVEVSGEVDGHSAQCVGDGARVGEEALVGRVVLRVVGSLPLARHGGSSPWWEGRRETAPRPRRRTFGGQAGMIAGDRGRRNGWMGLISGIIRLPSCLPYILPCRHDIHTLTGQMSPPLHSVKPKSTASSRTTSRASRPVSPASRRSRAAFQT